MPVRGLTGGVLALVMALPVGAVMDPAPRLDPQPKAQRPRAEKPQAEKQDPLGGGMARAPELRDETFRLMDAYVISNIQESLGLSDEQFTKILPLVKRLYSERRDFARRRMEALRSMRKALRSGSATEAGVGDLLKELKGVGADERAAATKNSEALDAVLTPVQQAKYRVFEAEVEVRLRKLLARTENRDRPAPR